jgi:hypothetical protein
MFDANPSRMPRQSPYRESAASPEESVPRLSPIGSLAIEALVASLVAFVVVVLVVGVVGDAPTASRRWTFTDGPSTAVELGFELASHRGGSWTVQYDDRATGGFAMVNAAGDANASPAMAVAFGPARRDLRARTRCRIPEGGPALACGLVFRYQDAQNHYLARLDAVERSITLTAVVDGRERPIAGALAEFPPHVWQEIAVEARGGHIRVLWNGAPVMEAHDRTFRTGGIGLWTPASSVAHFDVLAIDSDAG